MWSIAGAIEQLDEAASGAAVVLLAVGRPGAGPAFISGTSPDRLEQLRDLVLRAGAGPIGIIQVVEKNVVEFEIRTHALKEYALAPDRVRENAERYLEKAAEVAAVEFSRCRVG